MNVLGLFFQYCTLRFQVIDQILYISILGFASEIHIHSFNLSIETHKRKIFEAYPVQEFRINSILLTGLKFNCTVRDFLRP